MGEKLDLVLGYITAMNDVTNALEASRQMLSSARTASYGDAAGWMPSATGEGVGVTAEKIRDLQRRHGAATKAVASPRAMTDEEIGCLVPDLLSQLVRRWDFKGVELAPLGAYVQAIYSEAENVNVLFPDVLEIARDLLLRRITDAEAREELKTLRTR